MKIDIQSLRGLDAHRSADAELASRLVELNTEAAGAAFSAEQQEEFAAILEQREELAGIIAELDTREKAVAAALADGGKHVENERKLAAPNIIKTPDDIYDLPAYRQRVSSVDDLPQAYLDGAKRVIETAVFPTAPDQAKARENITMVVEKLKDENHGSVAQRVIGTESPSYRQAWAQYMSGGMNAVNPRFQAAMQSYSSADGGVALPVTIDPTFILTSNGAVNPWRTLARVEPITTKTWAPVTTAGVTAAYATEAAQAADGAPSDLAGPTLTPVRAHVWVPFSAEFNEDYGPAAIAAEIGRLISDSKDVLEATKFATGSGTNEPEGVIWKLDDDTTELVDTATASTFVLGDIDTLEGSLGARFRANAAFVANRTILQSIRGFGTAGQPANSIYDPLSKTLRGYPAYESTAMASTTEDGDEILLIGDFKAGFVIVDRVGLSTEYVPQVFGANQRPTGQRGIYARWRNTSKVLFVNAFRLLAIKAS